MNPPETLPQHTPSETAFLRSVFWQNVTQQILSSLPAMAAKNPHLLDGRVAVLTRDGERIPIKAVHPVFACSVPGSARDKALSLAVQCTVFRILTPSGEVFTLPLEEIRAVHTITEELMQQISEGRADEQDVIEPFGFAAYTALAKEQQAEAENEQLPPPSA